MGTSLTTDHHCRVILHKSTSRSGLQLCKAGRISQFTMQHCGSTVTVRQHGISMLQQPLKPSKTASSTMISAMKATTTTAPLDLCGISSAQLLWDLDNVCPSNVRKTMCPAIEEVKGLLMDLGLKHQPSVTCYANRTTTQMLGQPLLQQLTQAGVEIRQVKNKQQAADVRLRTDAYNFAQVEKAAGCLVVVTGDTGFAPVLAYCTSLGVTSIVVTPLPSPRYLPGLLPDAGEHSLAAACTAAVPWQQQARYSKPVRLQPPVGQQQQQQQQLESCSLDGSAVMGRTPLSSSAQYWHRLDSISGIGVLEPWMFMKKNPK